MSEETTPNEAPEDAPGSARQESPQEAADAPPRAAAAPPDEPPQDATFLPDESAAPTATPMVGIGASAGGLEALSALFSNLPSDTGLAFLIVQHLDRTHASYLTEILANTTRMKVSPAENGMPIEPDSVYVITPNTSLAVSDGHVIVTPRADDMKAHMPADLLFNSLAETLGNRSIGVLLSGTGSDGSLGMEAIKSKGGITFAQDEGTAKFYGMPGSAIASGCVDYILAPADIAKELHRIARHPYLASPTAHPEYEPSEEEWKRLFRMLRSVYAVDFSAYKRSTIRRRLLRRLALRRVDNTAAYLDVLQREPAELQALYQDFLIRVTSFFRDPETFEALAKTVFPSITERRNRNDTIRIWVPGCSTGEEVYSITIALLEFLGDAADTTSIQVFGTDVNPVAIERARSARYLENVALDIPPERLRRFFVKVDDHFEVAKRVRDLCIFATQNVGRDPPFSKLDLISCRNVLIYLDNAMQKRVTQVFHYALMPDRFLLLGPSETIGQGSDLFELVDKRNKIYRRALVTQPRMPMELPVGDRGAFTRARPASTTSTELFDFDRVQKDADQLLISRFAPGAILVDEAMNVLQFRGRTAPYVEHQSGSASLQLQKLVQPSLLVELSTAIEEAKKGQTVRRERVRVHDDHRERRVTIEVVPMKGVSESPRCLLVLFEPVEDKGERDQAPRAGLLDRVFRARPAAAPSPIPSALQRERDELKSEVETTRAYLHSIIEAHEAAQEELRSANEEVLSANEEFQSTNEELETAKEELQSANEELATTNEELTNRNIELQQVNVSLRRARDYSQGVVETVRFPLLLLNRDLRVRHANRAYYELFKASREETEDCLFFALEDGAWQDARLKTALAGVLADQTNVSGFEFRARFPRIGDRILMIDASRLIAETDGRAEFVLLSIEDVTERDQALRTTRQQAELLDQSHDAILVWELRGPIRYWNRGASELYGFSADEAIGKYADALLKTQRGVAYEAFEQALMRDGRWSGEQTHATRDGRRIVVDAVYTLATQVNGPPLVLETTRDVTDRKAAEEALRTQDRRKDEFLAMLGHELRNPLAPMANALALLRNAKDPKEVSRLHDMLERQTRMLARIVDDLLDVARVTQGRIELRREVIDLREVAARALDVTRDQYAAREQTLSYAKPREPIAALVDAARIEQVIVNLLSNASRYSPPRATVHLALEAQGPEAVIRVRDNGIGIAPDMIEHVFEPFMQVDRGASGRAGLGIGLTLVERITSLHGGRVEARSKGLGSGSEFIVRLPAGSAEDVAAEAEAQAAAAAAAAAAAHKTRQSGRRVLVVDDNDDSRESVADLVRSWGHEVDVVADGEGVVAAASAFKPDVVLLDIGLPDIDGYEIARRLRTQPGMGSLFIVAMTGYGTERDRIASRNAGIDEHLLKPIDLAALQRLLVRIPDRAP